MDGHKPFTLRWNQDVVLSKLKDKQRDLGITKYTAGTLIASVLPYKLKRVWLTLLQVLKLALLTSFIVNHSKDFLLSNEVSEGNLNAHKIVVN